MLTAACIYLSVCTVVCGFKAIGNLAVEKIGMGLLLAAEAAFCGFAANAVWQVS